MEEFVKDNGIRVSCRLKPIYGIREQKIIGAEVLLGSLERTGRWTDPVAVLREAEKNRWVYQIDLWVFKQACRLLNTIQNPNMKTIHIHLAYGTYLCYQNIRIIEALIKRYRIDPTRICLWFGKMPGQAEQKSVKKNLRQLREVGFLFGAEEFRRGTFDVVVTESPNYEFVWLNRHLLSHHPEQSLGESILKSTIRTYRNKGVEVIADGVWNAVQAERLKALGCTGLAGPFISSQLSPERFLEMYGQTGGGD